MVVTVPFSTGLTPLANAAAGQIRFNTTTNQMEMFDGHNWTQVATVTSKYELVLDEGKVYGARYHTIAPLGAEALWNEMMEWMVTTFGPTPADGVWTPGSRWYANNAKFWFRNTKDRDWFVLRWSV